MSDVMLYMPEAQGDEGLYLSKLFSDMNEDEIRKFVNVYRARRRDPNMILITCLAGLLGFAGIHRFLINQIGMGILYFLTAGLCMIGTIVDLVNHKDLAFQYNREIAQEIRALL